MTRTESVVWNDLDGRREENGRPPGLTGQEDMTRLKELASEQGTRRMGLEETGHTAGRLTTTSMTLKSENIEGKSAHPRRLNPPLENEPCVSELFPPSSACVASPINGRVSELTHYTLANWTSSAPWGYFLELAVPYHQQSETKRGAGGSY